MRCPVLPAAFAVIVLMLAGCGGGAGAGAPSSPAAPSILVEPSSQTSVAGESAAFSVVASGTAPLRYQWNRGGVPIPGATGATYTLASVQAGDDGAGFSVLVANAEGQARSLEAKLGVIEAVPPSITSQPADECVNPSDSATFTLSAAGVPAPAVQWYRNGLSIPGATGPAFTTPPVSPSDDGALYSATLSNEAGVLSSAPARLSVRASTASLDLSLDGLYLTQGVQTRQGGVTLVQGRDAYLRVFVKANQRNSAAPWVRVQVFKGSTLQTTYDLPAPCPSVPTTIDEGQLEASWNILVPGNFIQPGLAVLAEVDPCNTLAEKLKGNNVWPRSGHPQSMNVVGVAPFRTTLIPVCQSGLTGNVTADNLDRYVTWARKLYPLTEIDAKLGATYFTSTVVDNAGNGMGTLLSEIEAKRVVEGMGGERHYYGVYRLPNYDTYASSGRAYIPTAASTSGRSAIGHDLENTVLGRNYPEVFAHEIGHNFGRSHSPGCGAGDTDPVYPYGKDGHTGVYGLDLETLSLMAPLSTTDVMCYCTEHLWISDYVFMKVLAFRTSATLPIRESAGAEDCLLVWGRETGGNWAFEPCFQVRTLPMLGEAGPYHLRLEGADGQALLDLSVRAMPVGDSEEGDAHIVLAIPLRGLSSGVLQGVTLQQGEEVLATLRAPKSPLQQRGAATAPECRFQAGNRMELSWDAAIHPMALVRDAKRREVIAFARGGAIQVRTAAEQVEVILSDGLGNQSWTYARP